MAGFDAEIKAFRRGKEKGDPSILVVFPRLAAWAQRPGLDASTFATLFRPPRSVLDPRHRASADPLACQAVRLLQLVAAFLALGGDESRLRDHGHDVIRAVLALHPAVEVTFKDVVDGAAARASSQRALLGESGNGQRPVSARDD